MSSQNHTRTRQSVAVCFSLGAVALIGLLTGCDSDDPNLTGIGLFEAEIDSVLIPLEIVAFEASGNLSVGDLDEPFYERQVLYFGNQETESSSMLARWDFADIPPEFPDSLFTPANIEKVDLIIYMLQWYTDFRVVSGTDTTALVKSYWVLELQAPLDQTQYPGPDPATFPSFVNENPNELEPVGANIILPIAEDKYLEWYQAGTHNGVMISQGSTGQEVDGFIGFTSREFTKFSQIDDELEGTLAFPTLLVSFVEPDTVMRMVAIEDVSTLNSLDPIPASIDNGMVVRTHVRSYPYFRIGLDAIPPNVFINRAYVQVVNDTSQSYGPNMSLVLSGIDSSFASGGEVTTNVQILGTETEAVSVRTGLDPYGGVDGSDIVLQFTITSYLQGQLNGAPGEPLNLTLTGAEDFYGPGFNLSGVDPAFYLNRFTFFGTQDPDLDKRPYLKVVYTLDTDISESGE